MVKKYDTQINVYIAESKYDELLKTAEGRGVSYSALVRDGIEYILRKTHSKKSTGKNTEVKERGTH